jgi:hypothetical protein
MRVEGACSYEKTCLFAHTLAEISIWGYQKDLGLKDFEELYKIIHSLLGEEPLAEPPSKKTFYRN